MGRKRGGGNRRRREIPPLPSLSRTDAERQLRVEEIKNRKIKFVWVPQPENHSTKLYHIQRLCSTIGIIQQLFFNQSWMLSSLNRQNLKVMDDMVPAGVLKASLPPGAVGSVLVGQSVKECWSYFLRPMTWSQLLASWTNVEKSRFSHDRRRGVSEKVASKSFCRNFSVRKFESSFSFSGSWLLRLIINSLENSLREKGLREEKVAHNLFSYILLLIVGI